MKFVYFSLTERFAFLLKAKPTNLLKTAAADMRYFTRSKLSKSLVHTKKLALCDK